MSLLGRRRASMLELFLKLVEKVTDLLKERQKSRRAVMDDVIDPLFKEMPLVVQDYLSLFAKAEEHLRRSSGPGDSQLHDVISDLKSRREKFLAIRIKLREMASLIQLEFSDERIVGFAVSVEEFFFSLETLRSHRSTSDSAVIVELFEELNSSVGSPQDIFAAIADARYSIEHSWAEVTRAYARIRIDLLKSPV
jgi:hypothetical protein